MGHGDANGTNWVQPRVASSHACLQGRQHNQRNSLLALFALLALLRPSLAQCLVKRACLCRLKFSTWGCIECVACVGLCLQAGSAGHRSFRESVGLSCLGPRVCVENASALKLLPSLAACGKYEGLPGSTGSESIERVTEYSPQAAELDSSSRGIKGIRGIHTSAGRTGTSSL